MRKIEKIHEIVDKAMEKKISEEEALEEIKKVLSGRDLGNLKITDCLGSSSRIKVIEFLIKNKDKGMSVREILSGAKVKHRNLVDMLEDFLGQSVIYIERKIGKSNLYKVNELHGVIEALMFAQETADAAAGESEK